MTTEAETQREIGRMDGRLEALEKRVDGLEVRIDGRLVSIEAKLDVLTAAKHQVSGAAWTAKLLYGLLGTGVGAALLKLLHIPAPSA